MSTYKPCPRCGSKAVVFVGRTASAIPAPRPTFAAFAYAALCEACGLYGEWRTSGAAARAAWNALTRPAAPRVRIREVARA